MRCTYVPEDQEFWEEFLMNGYGLGSYAGVPYQRGGGIGAIFRGLFRTAAPILRQIGLNLGKKAFEAGADIMGDVSEGKKFKEVAKQRIKQRGKQGFFDVAGTIGKAMQSGQGVGMRPKRKSIKRKTPIDIFTDKKIRYG